MKLQGQRQSTNVERAGNPIQAAAQAMTKGGSAAIGPARKTTAPETPMSRAKKYQDNQDAMMPGITDRMEDAAESDAAATRADHAKRIPTPTPRPAQKTKRKGK